MFFLLQNESSDTEHIFNIETEIWKNLINKRSHQDFYNEISLSDLDKNWSESLIASGVIKSPKEAIPLGTIQFTEKYFSQIYNIKQMNPIEVPKCLRTDEFLQRKYKICKYLELPSSGDYFIKDVSCAKAFSYCGDISLIEKDNSPFHTNLPNKEHLFQISDIVNPVAEYRVYIYSGEVQAITEYAGDPFIFPDVKKINKMDAIYSLQPDYPGAYTMDIMILDTGETCLCECHILFSCGLYNSVFTSRLLDGYAQAKRYILNHNTKISI